MKSATTKLNFNLKNIIGNAFDGAANMNGIHKELSTGMVESPQLRLLRTSISLFRILWHGLNHCKTIWGLFRLSTTSIRHALFSDREVQGEDLKLTMSLSFTRWSYQCRVETHKGRIRKMERVVKALITLSSDKDPKTYSGSRALLTAIFNLEFIFGICAPRVILSNTNRHYISSLKYRHDHSDLTPASEWRKFQMRMADTISNGSENEEVVSHFSV